MMPEGGFLLLFFFQLNAYKNMYPRNIQKFQTLLCTSTNQQTKLHQMTTKIN